MAPAQLPHRTQQVFDILVADIGDHHHQRTSRLAPAEFGRGGGIVGRDRLRLQVVDRAEHAVERAAAARRLDEARLATMRQQAHGVALAQCDPGQQQAGVEHVVEVRERVVARQHAAAGVEQQQHLLVAFLAVVARDQLARALARLPVDLAQAVALAVLAQLVELGAIAAAPAQVRAEHAAGLVGADQRQARERREVGIDLDRRRGRDRAPLRPQAQRRVQAQLHRRERVAAAFVRGDVVVEAGAGACRKIEPARQPGDPRTPRMAVVHVDAHACASAGCSTSLTSRRTPSGSTGAHSRCTRGVGRRSRRSASNSASAASVTAPMPSARRGAKPNATSAPSTASSSTPAISAGAGLIGAAPRPWPATHPAPGRRGGPRSASPAPARCGDATPAARCARCRPG